jgi:hypothetical protein
MKYKIETKAGQESGRIYPLIKDVKGLFCAKLSIMGTAKWIYFPLTRLDLKNDEIRIGKGISYFKPSQVTIYACRTKHTKKEKVNYNELKKL